MQEVAGNFYSQPDITRSLRGQREAQQRPFSKDKGSATTPEIGHGMKRWQVPSKWAKRRQDKDGGWLQSRVPMGAELSPPRLFPRTPPTACTYKG